MRFFLLFQHLIDQVQRLPLFIENNNKCHIFFLEQYYTTISMETDVLAELYFSLKKSKIVVF